MSGCHIDPPSAASRYTCLVLELLAASMTSRGTRVWDAFLVITLIFATCGLLGWLP